MMLPMGRASLLFVAHASSSATVSATDSRIIEAVLRSYARELPNVEGVKGVALLPRSAVPKLSWLKYDDTRRSAGVPPYSVAASTLAFRKLAERRTKSAHLSF